MCSVWRTGSTAYTSEKQCRNYCGAVRQGEFRTINHSSAPWNLGRCAEIPRSEIKMFHKWRQCWKKTHLLNCKAHICRIWTFLNYKVLKQFSSNSWQRLHSIGKVITNLKHNKTVSILQSLLHVVESTKTFLFIATYHSQMTALTVTVTYR